MNPNRRTFLRALVAVPLAPAMAKVVPSSAVVGGSEAIARGSHCIAGWVNHMDRYGGLVYGHPGSGKSAYAVLTEAAKVIQTEPMFYQRLK